VPNAPERVYCCSRLCQDAFRFSSRVSTQATARRSRRAAYTSAMSSRARHIFWPKAPPTSGATTRSRSAGIPSAAQMPVLVTCGTWVEVVRVTRPVARS
jgi:hypothetical protein